MKPKPNGHTKPAKKPIPTQDPPPSEPVSTRPRKGVRVAPAAAIVTRKEGDAWARCYFNVGGLKQHRFPFAEVEQSAVAERWGSGRYRVTRVSATGAVAGGGREFEIDDPRFPTKPLYPNPPAQLPAEAPAASPGLDMASLLMAGGQIPPLVLMQFMMGVQREATSQARQDAEHLIQRERLSMQQTLEGQRLLYQALIDASRAPAAAPSSDPSVMRAIEELRESIDEISDRDPEPPREETPTDKVMRAIQGIIEQPHIQQALLSRLLPAKT